MKFEIVAEVGPCEGDVEYARRVIQRLAGTGISMKVQWYDADTLAHPTAKRYDHTDDRDLTQHELFQQQLSWAHWAMIRREAQAAGVEFFPTVFSDEAIEKAAGMGLDRVKIASGDITYHQLIAHAAETMDRLVISTGGATEAEIDMAVGAAKAANPKIELTMLACHLEYPTDLFDANLARVSALKNKGMKDGYEVGYSDHTAGIQTSAVLPLLGATMWEKHVTVGGPAVNPVGDHTFAVVPEDFAVARKAISGIFAMLGSPRLEPTEGEAAARVGARRGTYATRDIKKGEVLERADVEFLRPAEGMSPAQFKQWEGAKAMVDIPAGVPIRLNQFGHVGGSLTVE